MEIFNFLVCALVLATGGTLGLPQPNGREYPLRLQPELDAIDVEAYLNNPKLLNLQIKCILFDGPCDVVGRWAKPRVKAGLLGECLLCTEKQKGWLDTWLVKLMKQHPDLYRAGVAKYILNAGVQLPEDELHKLQAVSEKYEKVGLDLAKSAAPAEASLPSAMTQGTSVNVQTKSDG